MKTNILLFSSNKITPYFKKLTNTMIDIFQKFEEIMKELKIIMKRIIVKLQYFCTRQICFLVIYVIA